MLFSDFTFQSEVESLKAANQHLTSQKENLIVDSNAKVGLSILA